MTERRFELRFLGGLCLLILSFSISVPVSGAGGFFSVRKERGIWWLVDPQGAKFISRGVNVVDTGIDPGEYNPSNSAYSALRFYATESIWREAAVERIKQWGFNTLGGWCSEAMMKSKAMPYAVSLHMGAGAGVPWTDPMSEKAVEFYRKEAASLARYREDPLLIGYFIDNELGWWDETMLFFALKAPLSNPIKAVVFDVIRKQYGGNLKAVLNDFTLKPEPKVFTDLKGEFKTALFKPGKRPVVVERFVEALADRYYRAVTAEIRKVDPNHLILGDRYASFYSQPVARVAGKYLDVVSTNYNTFSPDGWAARFYFESLYRLSGRPVMVTEFYFAAMENASGNQNRNGPFMTVRTQAERARGAARMVSSMISFPFVLGYHWFQYYDEPPLGRDKGGGGEDFNMGLVSVQNEVYSRLTDSLTAVNSKSEALHGRAPEAGGVRRGPSGWKAADLAGAPVADGRMSEWNLENSWVMGTKSVAPFERFGDFFVAWSPGGICVAVVYMDYRAQPRIEGGPEEESDRLTVGLGLEGEKPVVCTLMGVNELKDPAKPEMGYRIPELLAVRGGVPFPAEGRFSVGQGSAGVCSVVELFFPVELFKRQNFTKGDILRIAASLRLRGNFKELFWPAPFKRLDYEESSGWAPLAL